MDLVVDRIENDYLVLERDLNTFINVPKSLVPDAKEGDIITIYINKNKTKEQKAKIDKLVNDLFVEE